MFVWRISNYADLSGFGGLVTEGRWHKLGTRVIYCADSSSGALLETMVHLPKEDMPKTYQLLKIELPDHHVWDFRNVIHAAQDKVKTEHTEKLFKGVELNWDYWFSIKNDFDFSQELGNLIIYNKFLMRAGQLLAFKVPSALVANSWNIILNPNSIYMKDVKIISAECYPFDTRLTS